MVLFALLAIACSSGRENGQADVAASAPAFGDARLTISLSPAKPPYSPAKHGPPIGENIAPLASGLAFIRGDEGHLVEDEEAYLAIDGDPETIWSSKQPAPQWYSIRLDQHYLVDRVELVVTQAPPGPTTHEIWLGHGSGLRTFYTRLEDVHSEDGQVLAVPIDPPQSVNEVLILTLHSPSWVAWRDFRVFGVQPGDSIVEEEAPPYAVAQVATGLNYPVRVTHAGDNSGRIFVVELPGRIRILHEGAIDEAPFLDISERVNCCVGERGMFGLAFPPSYPESGQFYVSYTNSQGDTTISRFATTEDPNLADENSEEILFTIDQPHENHNGGHLEFGPRDGYLYIGSGDGGLPRDPLNRGQTTDTLLGKLLRIDVESGTTPYSVPADNPFVQDDDHRPEIWALGLRNPWGFAFDRQSGDLYLPDTGNSKREEVNFQPAGAGGGQNYGWPVMEGSICFEHDVLNCSAQDLVLPVADYDHTRGCAIVGGAVYAGQTLTGLQGAFIVADFCTSLIWAIQRSEESATRGKTSIWRSQLLASAGMPISSVGADEEGNVYFTIHVKEDGAVYTLALK
ncbi:MAG: PQQ-dependent sugar dehydrogenase [Caldilineaceae bacterium]|nr:PQQ-dependent sugar dehydrogenase [Caldilineaceae bacterium]